eukprot:jgi/Botrbrau1/16567/Bobra.0262s0004.1
MYAGEKAHYFKAGVHPSVLPTFLRLLLSREFLVSYEQGVGRRLLNNLSSLSNWIVRQFRGMLSGWTVLECFCVPSVCPVRTPYIKGNKSLEYVAMLSGCSIKQPYKPRKVRNFDKHQASVHNYGTSSFPYSSFLYLNPPLSCSNPSLQELLSELHLSASRHSAFHPCTYLKNMQMLQPSTILISVCPANN